MLIFGEPWGAPLCDDAERFPEVPTWADCLRCKEAFVEGDAGVLMPHVGSVDARHVVGGSRDAWLVGEHRECFIAGTLGHLVGVCSCTGWDSTSRAVAREVQRRVYAGSLLR